MFFLFSFPAGALAISERNVQPINAKSSTLKKYPIFSVLIAIALLLIIILECILVALVVTKDKDNREVSTVSLTKIEEKNGDGLPKVDGRLNISEVLRRNCRDIQEKDSEARGGLNMIRVTGMYQKFL